MPVAIRLLGAPEIERDGSLVAPPRGHKTWAVLAYILLAERPVPRAQLAGLIFSEANDPLGALRWTLSELRRALGTPGALTGDPIRPNLPADVSVDVLALAGDDERRPAAAAAAHGAQLEGGDAGPLAAARGAKPERSEAGPLAAARGVLLDGVEADAGPVFDAWLLVERRRWAGVCAAAQRGAALAALAAGRPLDGAALATRALEHDPYDESVHELLVRCLARAGQSGAARHHATATEVLFLRELGRRPDPRVARAAEDDAPGAPGTAAGDRAVAASQLAAGRAALDAGAVEPGIACLRLARAEAAAAGDERLLAQVVAALGTALVHAVRGRDEEGAALLHEALAHAEAAGDRELAAKVCRELGFVDVQAGRAFAAGRWLIRATELAREPAERAAVLGVRGMALSDRAHYPAAIALLQESVAVAEASGDVRQAAWSLAILGRVHVLRDQREEAITVLDASLARVEDARWFAFQPFPEALRAEVALADGDRDHAADLLEHAFGLGCRIGDPCWEAIAARARAGLDAEGSAARVAALRDAAERAVRVADPYVWIHTHCLEALARAELAQGDEAAARATVVRLDRIAARAGFAELTVRAGLLRGRLGELAAAEAAALLAQAIDNPRLAAELDRHTAGHTAAA